MLHIYIFRIYQYFTRWLSYLNSLVLLLTHANKIDKPVHPLIQANQDIIRHKEDVFKCSMWQKLMPYTMRPNPTQVYLGHDYYLLAGLKFDFFFFLLPESQTKPTHYSQSYGFIQRKERYQTGFRLKIINSSSCAFSGSPYPGKT